MQCFSFPWNIPRDPSRETALQLKALSEKMPEQQIVRLMGISVYDFSIKIAQQGSSRATCRGAFVQQFKDIKAEIIPT